MNFEIAYIFDIIRLRSKKGGNTMSYDLAERVASMLVDVKELIKLVEFEQKQLERNSEEDEYWRVLDLVEYKLGVAYAALRETHESLSGI